MASPGEMRDCLAAALGIPEPTLFVHDRNLAEAGLRSKGGRGRSAAKVTALDCANLLIAAMGSPFVKDTVATVEQFSKLPARNSEYRSKGSARGNEPKNWKLDFFPIPELQALGEDHSFGDALVALISAAAQGRITSPLHVEVRLWLPEGQAAIEIADYGKGVEVHPYSNIPDEIDDILAWAAANNERPAVDLTQMRQITDRTVNALGTLLASEPRA